MKTPTLADLRSLADAEPGLCVSMAFPTHVGSDQAAQDPVRLKNAVRRAKDLLVSRGMRAPDANALLEAIENLPLDKQDWRTRSAGLAVYRSAKDIHVFRLHAAPPDRVIVGERFAVTPLVASLAVEHRFHVLAISRQAVRLLDADLSSFELATVENLPGILELARNAERNLQLHSGTPGKHKQSAVFHGQGGRSDALNDELSNYWRMIDNALTSYLAGTEGPVFLAGVDADVAGFRDVSRCTQLAEESVHGNFDRMSDSELYAHVLPLAQEFFGREQGLATEKFRELDGTEHATANIEVVLPAAREGRVETLFVNPFETMAGHFNAEEYHVVHDNDAEPHQDLIESAVAQTIRHRGMVYAVDADQMPGPGAVAAIFRF